MPRLLLVGMLLLAVPASAAALADAPTPSSCAPGDASQASLADPLDASTLVPLMAPLGADPPLVPGACSGRISPGVAISTPVGGCSLAFIFRDAASEVYAGTAGHCFSAVGQRMTVSGLGAVGSVVYFVNGGLGNDFALVKIDAAKVPLVNPAMCHWGGPTALPPGSQFGTVRHYGNGLVWGTTAQTRPRTGHAAGAGQADHFQFHGLAASGDSGSGIRMDTGEALGIITHVNGGAVIAGHSAPLAFGTRIHRAIQLAEAGTGLDLTLATAPNA